MMGNGVELLDWLGRTKYQHYCPLKPGYFTEIVVVVIDCVNVEVKFSAYALAQWQVLPHRNVQVAV